MADIERPPGDEHPRDPEAIEYVLGTLPAAERAAFEAAVASDPNLAARLRGWEERLVPLAASVPPVEPSASVWPAISRRLGGGAAILAFPQREIDGLRRASARWRNAAVAAAALAAALAGFIASERLVERPALLAVVNRDGNLPALVVRVDQRAGTIQVRSLAADVPADRSLELWSVASGQPTRSLGIVPTTSGRMKLPSDVATPVAGGTIAVSLEPKGGSPTGVATGPVVYSGRLVQDAP